MKRLNPGNASIIERQERSPGKRDCSIIHQTRSPQVPRHTAGLHTCRISPLCRQRACQQAALAALERGSHPQHPAPTSLAQPVPGQLPARLLEQRATHLPCLGRLLTASRPQVPAPGGARRPVTLAWGVLRFVALRSPPLPVPPHRSDRGLSLNVTGVLTPLPSPAPPHETACPALCPPSDLLFKTRSEKGN